MGCACGRASGSGAGGVESAAEGPSSLQGPWKARLQTHNGTTWRGLGSLRNSQAEPRGETGLTLLLLGVASCLGLVPAWSPRLALTYQCGLRGLTEASLQGDGAQGSPLRPTPALLNRSSEQSLHQRGQVDLRSAKTWDACMCLRDPAPLSGQVPVPES